MSVCVCVFRSQRAEKSMYVVSYFCLPDFKSVDRSSFLLLSTRAERRLMSKLKLITSRVNFHTAEPRVDPRPVNLAVFVLSILATGQGFLRVHSFTPVSIVSPVSPLPHLRPPHTLTFFIFLLPILYSLSNWLCHSIRQSIVLLILAVGIRRLRKLVYIVSGAG